MKSVFTAAGLVVGASAAVLPRQDQCCFQLTASGGQSGQVGQLSDGQNRIGGGYAAATYCLNGGAITDESGRGCILTPPTTQFQCDTGATPTPGFSVSSSGEVEYNGSGTFYACGATDNEYNIYTTPVSGQQDCVEIQLSTGGKCGGAGASGSASASQPAASSAVSAESSAPGYSAPASSAPIYSAPASSAPVESAPAYSAPASCNSVVTVTTTVYSCESSPAPGFPAPSSTAPVASVYSSVPGAPSSAWGYPAPSSNAPAPSESYPAPGYSSPAGPASWSASAPGYPASGSNAPVASQSYPVSESAPVSESVPAPTQTYGASSSAAAATPPAYTTTAPASGTQPATSAATGSACQTSLVSGSYETPHLIVPISSESPDSSYGTSYNGQVNSTTSSVFNFDIPQSYAGKTCSLVFLFPQKADLETSDYTFNGQGSIDFAQLSGAATESTTWNTCPAHSQDLGSVTPQPGNSYVIQSGACAAGTTKAIELSGAGGLGLNFFEDYNPSPLGLFITVC